MKRAPVRTGQLERRVATPAELGIEAHVLARFATALGPLAIVDLETTGLSPDDGAEILELGALLIEPGEERITTITRLLRPQGPIPRAVTRLTGIRAELLQDAPPLETVREAFCKALAGRTLIAHNAAFERSFLGRYLHPGFEQRAFLDTLDLLALTHPDAPDMRLASFTRLLLDCEEQHRALADALDTARVMALAAVGAAAGQRRFVNARRALLNYAPETPWLALLEAPAADAKPGPTPPAFAQIGASEETPTPFDEDAIAAVLKDEARCRRYLPGYRLRAEQVELARHFVRNLDREEVLLAEGGTGVGKSLAYLAAAIPFAMQRFKQRPARAPVLLSTRTKLLQDQLLTKDIPAAARLLGWPELRAVSIKGRANYACARRLEATLAGGSERSIFPEQRLAFAVLEASVATRAHGEIGALPAALYRRYQPLAALLQRSVTQRADQCTREQCAKVANCPLGQRRRALSDAQLIVANHDLLLRWPSDYPNFEHAIVDEAHELSDVADEVYAVLVQPDQVIERFDEIFGHPAAPKQRRNQGLLSAKQRRELSADAPHLRRALYADLASIGRALQPQASEYGEVQIADPSAAALALAAQHALHTAEQIEALCARIPEHEDAHASLPAALDELRGAVRGLRLAFAADEPGNVAGFENINPPFDRWRLIVRQVSPADDFHAQFMDRLKSFAAVSASLFVANDAFAAFGDLDLEARASERLQHARVASPFDYPKHMRVVAMRGGQNLVSETAQVLEQMARALGGRTLGLFTSLRRLSDTSDELATRLSDEGLDVITPRGAHDDPFALVTRFVNGAGVLLGARRFWQGIDIPGDALQAVVIEKLPFEVPTELRRRRERRLEKQGINAFERYQLGKMLLNLKQMVGRLIRSEEDRGIVIIVEGRSDKSYFQKLEHALPPGSRVVVAELEELDALLASVGIAREA